MGPFKSSANRHLWGVLLPFVAFVVFLIALAGVGFQLLSGVRAFVGGESQWSKARAEAVSALRSYVFTGRPSDLDRFDVAMKVSLGDRRARDELLVGQGRLEVAEAGFIAGGNHPRDVPTMVRLLRLGGDTPLLRDAVRAWVSADKVMEELFDLKMLLTSTGPSREDRDAVLREIDRLNELLINQEREFSQSLGQASQQVTLLVFGSVASVALVLTLGVVVYMRHRIEEQAGYQEHLHELNLQWSLAADSSGIGVFAWDIGSDTVALDLQAASHYGFDVPPGMSEVAVSRNDIAERVPSDDRQTIHRAFERAVKTRLPFSTRYRVRLQDGMTRHFEASGLVRKLEAPSDGLRLFGIVRNVESQIRLSELEVQRQAAERVDRTRVAFLSRLSHELRTPLNAILGFSQLALLGRELPPDAGVFKKVERIEDAGKHLLRLVEDVLDLSRIDAGEAQLQMECVHLGNAIDEALRMSEDILQQFQIVVAREVEPGADVEVRADRGRLHQVLVNLISNGCKYNRSGGTLLVRQQCTAARASVVFVDEGEGILPEHLSQLFVPFKRLTKTTVEGTGLGLSICKSLVEQMGGSIRAESGPSKGAQFQIAFDVCEPCVQNTTEAESQP